jgi:two-component system phosphate regulon sensor histidine kinase PhoR
MAEAAFGVAAGLAAALVVCSIAALIASRALRSLTRDLQAIARDETPRDGTRPPGPLAEISEAIRLLATRVHTLTATATEERERVGAVLNSTADAVLAVDLEGRIAFANVAAERLLARDQGELIGRSLAWVLPEEQVLEALRSGPERTQTTRVEYGRRYLEVTAAPIVGGGDWAALIVCHDMTDVKRTEDVRRDFVANVSHELRTPLAALKAVIETLQAGAMEDPEAGREFLARADGEVDRLVVMVEELLELSRIESGSVDLPRQPLEPAVVISSAAERLRPYAEQSGLELHLEIPGDLPPVTGDAERLERAIVNLIRNAIEFTPEGGSVSVKAAAEDGSLDIRVADTGVGIPAADRPRVFERFFKASRARGGGTGLGLAIVKHTVEAHGGSVAVESEEGRGSTFTITLPASGHL